MSEFMERARAEAERRWPGCALHRDCEHQMRDEFQKRDRFLTGAQWAVEQEPTDQERIALVDSLDWAIRGTTDGDRIDLDTEIPVGEVMRLIEEGARAALIAAQKVRAGQ